MKRGACESFVEGFRSGLGAQSLGERGIQDIIHLPERASSSEFLYILGPLCGLLRVSKSILPG